MGLADKAVVITGSGRGVGRACAIAAAGLGASVVVNDRDLDCAEAVVAEIQAGGGQAVADGADVSDWEGSKSLIEHCVSEFGAIHGLVNNAGIYRPEQIDQCDEALWRATVGVNVLGVGFCSTHAIRYMRAQGGGAIVSMSSIAHQGGKDMAPYGMSKGAVASLTYCMAMELEGTGVRANALTPVAMTRMIETELAFAASRGRETVVNDPPMPENNAPLVCYLLSDDSAPLTGQIFRIQRDGITILAHPFALASYPRFDTRDYEAVHEAFKTQLNSQSQPLGLNFGSVDYSAR